MKMQDDFYNTQICLGLKVLNFPYNHVLNKDFIG